MPPSTPIILLETNPVFTIHRTVSAISSGVPSLPTGISEERQQRINLLKAGTHSKPILGVVQGASWCLV